MKSRLTFLITLMLLHGCSLYPVELEGDKLAADATPQERIASLTEAVRQHPEEVGYRTNLTRAIDDYVLQSIAQGEQALVAGTLEKAAGHFQDALRYHPENARAHAGLASIESARHITALLKEAEDDLAKNEPDAARGLLRSILAKDPANAKAKALLKVADEKAGRTRGAEQAQLAATFRRPITLQFKDAPVKSMFDAISRQSGLNFIFDKDVNVSQRSTVFANETALAGVLDMVLATSQLAKKVLNGNTLLIYPNTSAKQKDYQDMVVKSFFLANANAKDTMNLLRTMARIRDIHVDERLNMVVVRDTAEAVAVAEKLVAMSDRPEAEVMLQVEIMEVGGTKLQELGLQWPSQFSVLVPESKTTSRVVGGVVVTDSVPGSKLTVESLSNITKSDIAVYPNPTLNLLRTDGNVNILANPRIRVKSKEKARIHIGDKLPVITSNVTATGVTSESVTYLDAGLKLDVEPLVRLEGDVEIKVGLEVSNISGTVKTNNGTVAYQLGSRNAVTVLRLKDGETQVLAGLISDSERASANKVPGLGDIPILGRLFSNNRDEAGRSEIVLLITPRVLRNIERPDLADSEFFAGTESTVSDQPMRLKPATAKRPSTRPSAAPASGRAEETVDEPATRDTEAAEPAVETTPAP